MVAHFALTKEFDLLQTVVPRPVEERDRIHATTRRNLEARTPWAKNHKMWEQLGGIVAQPINFPHYEDELVIFPRDVDMHYWFRIQKDLKERQRYYKERLNQIVGNYNREGRGKFIFIIVPNTFLEILRRIEQYPGQKVKEVIHGLHSQYFKGKRPEEVECKVDVKTLKRYLTRAEIDLDILGEKRSTLQLGFRTLETCYTVLRYGRDGQIDIRPYFLHRMF